MKPDRRFAALLAAAGGRQFTIDGADHFHAGRQAEPAAAIAGSASP